MKWAKIDALDEEESDSDDDRDSGSMSDSASEKGDPLTLEAVDKKLHQLKEDKKKARWERIDIDAKIKATNEIFSDLDKKKSEIEAAMSAVCIAGRNKYSRGAIQTDFAAGIKELDQENVQEED
ncbi:hypothetical protein G7Y89_g1737 [Cudoniella acicularis]|uniref:Uncharacterized protein n=1 Tax=Cudoniella acicularis TaxID=354080 RepID=A0A8H4RUN8_9HELO|nr:hypothetical protein G7Y89_g1737 [Cudoniella acicularis]